MRIDTGLPPGVNALLFESAAARRRMEQQLTSAVVSRGYEEAILPILDYFEPYASLVRRSRREELYRFVDPDGELLAVRADFTPMLARLLAPKLGSLDLPLRLFYRGDVVRRQTVHSRGPSESAQLGVELLSALDASEGERDREIFELFCDLLGGEILEQQQIEVVIGLAGALDPLLGEQSSDSAVRLLDALKRRDRRVAREAGSVFLEVVENGRPSDVSVLGPETAAQLQRLDDLCDQWSQKSNLSLSVDLAEFAALSLGELEGAPKYYDGLMLRAYTARDARPIAAGGRYDSLFQRLGAPVRAVGFSLSLDQLVASALDGEGDRL